MIVICAPGVTILVLTSRGWARHIERRG